MKKYVFEEYRSKRGIGSEELFDTEIEAIECVEGEWNHLSRYDQKSYLNDPEAWFWVYEIEITPEQLREYEDNELDVPLRELWTKDIVDMIAVNEI